MLKALPGSSMKKYTGMYFDMPQQQICKFSLKEAVYGIIVCVKLSTLMLSFVGPVELLIFYDRLWNVHQTLSDKR